MDENLDKILNQVLLNSEILKTGVPDYVFEEILTLQFKHQEDPATALRETEKVVNRYLESTEEGE